MDHAAITERAPQAAQDIAFRRGLRVEAVPSLVHAIDFGQGYVGDRREDRGEQHQQARDGRARRLDLQAVESVENGQPP